MIVILSQPHCQEQAMDSRPKGLISGQIDDLGRGHTEDISGQAYLFAFGSLRHAFGASFRPPLLLGH